MSIDIFTVTCGREFYLNRVLDSLRNMGCAFNHYLVLNACECSPEMRSKLERLGVHVFEQSERISIGDCINKFKKYLTSDLTFKLDDDAILCTERFGEHLLEISKLTPASVFSPYPVGLINNPGGPSSRDHFVKYSEGLDTYYSFRKVRHVGGFARVTPRWLLDEVNFNPGTHSEDAELSKYCGENDVEMFYLENAIIVEHAESTLGQLERDKEYFSRSRDWMKGAEK